MTPERGAFPILMMVCGLGIAGCAVGMLTTMPLGIALTIGLTVIPAMVASTGSTGGKGKT